jgi:hypothetical protein
LVTFLLKFLVPLYSCEEFAFIELGLIEADEKLGKWCKVMQLKSLILNRRGAKISITVTIRDKNLIEILLLDHLS